MFKIDFNAVIASLLTIAASIQGSKKNVVDLYEIIYKNIKEEK